MMNINDVFLNVHLFTHLIDINGFPSFQALREFREFSLLTEAIFL